MDLDESEARDLYLIVDPEGDWTHASPGRIEPLAGLNLFPPVTTQGSNPASPKQSQASNSLDTNTRPVDRERFETLAREYLRTTAEFRKKVGELESKNGPDYLKLTHDLTVKSQPMLDDLRNM